LISETDLLKNIDHPNIVKIIETFADYSNFYIITEYCMGTTSKLIIGGELFQRIRTITNYSEKYTSLYMK
jgi:calcium-dependent protein kinase